RGAVDGLTAAAGLADHLQVAARLEDAAQAVAHHRVVVGDQQPDHRLPPSGMAGTLADTAVPPPGSDSISSWPASRVTRCRIAVSPKPPFRSSVVFGVLAGQPLPFTVKPAPSSRTSRVTTSPM